MFDDEGDDFEKEKEDQIKEIVDGLNRDIQMPPYDNSSKKGYSKQYKEYKEQEERSQQVTRYEKLCQKMGGLFNLTASGETHEKLAPPIRLLRWDITPGMVLSASVGVGLFSMMGWMALAIVNMMLGFLIPLSILMISGVVPIAAAGYTYYKPIYDAKNKVIRSSGEMILSILYMVIYMRSSPNLEGGIRFAALNLEGPISDDLKGVLWDLEVGKFNSIEEALGHYTRSWKGYNDDYLESLQLLKAAVNEPNDKRREDLLQDAIDRILDGTREKMKHYAQSLKMPVMILNAMGAMLPVLGMIMLPLVSVFMGEAITEMHLFLIFNIMLPSFLYWFMQRVLSSRPPTVSSKPVSDAELPPRGKYPMSIMGRKLYIPTAPIGAVVFLTIAAYGLLGYLAFPEVYPLNLGQTDYSIADVPGIFTDGEESLSPMAMLMRSLAITSGLGIGIGVSKILGNVRRKEAEEHLKDIESQFPTALFQLGNKISGGTPIELALQEASEATSDLEISELFAYSSRNIRQMGMTFEDSLFDPKYGSLRKFPSQMINTVMKAILESSEKGTKMASMAMMTISRYLENIHKTQENLNDLMEETTTTIQMLAYLLAPVVSGVAVGMSQTIITAMFELGSSFDRAQEGIDSGGAGAGGAGADPGFAGIIGNLDTAIPPEVLQFVVGIYLIQLLYILGTFYMKIQHGEDKVYRDMFVGKVLISGITIYSITLIIVSFIFGGIVSGIEA